MYEIQQCDYHYYYELKDYMNLQLSAGWYVVQVISITPSGDNQKMHRATILFHK